MASFCYSCNYIMFQQKQNIFKFVANKHKPFTFLRGLNSVVFVAATQPLAAFQTLQKPLKFTSASNTKDALLVS